MSAADLCPGWTLMKIVTVTACRAGGGDDDPPMEEVAHDPVARRPVVAVNGRTPVNGEVVGAELLGTVRGVPALGAAAHDRPRIDVAMTRSPSSAMVPVTVTESPVFRRMYSAWLARERSTLMGPLPATYGETIIVCPAIHSTRPSMRTRSSCAVPTSTSSVNTQAAAMAAPTRALAHPCRLMLTFWSIAVEASRPDVWSVDLETSVSGPQVPPGSLPLRKDGPAFAVL